MLTSEVQEEPDGLYSYHLPKDMTQSNFFAWAPMLTGGVAAGEICHQAAEQHCIRALRNFDIFCPHSCLSYT